MSLQEEIEEIMQDGVVAFLPAEQIVMMKTDTSERVINKVLDAAVEAADSKRHKLSKQLSPDDRDNIFFNAGVDTSIEAINKLRVL